MLDNDSVMAKTVNGFKNKLERERAKKMGLVFGLMSAGPRGRNGILQVLLKDYEIQQKQ